MTEAQQRVIDAGKAYVAASEIRWGKPPDDNDEYMRRVIALSDAEVELGKSVLALREEET